MTTKNYITYRRYDVIAYFLSVVIWTSLTSFTILAKNNLGIDTITIMESLLFIVSIIGVRIGFRSCISYKQIMLIDITIESIFLILILYLIHIHSNNIGLGIYFAMAVNHMVRPAIREKERTYDDVHLKHSRYKKILKSIREYESYITSVGGVIGTSIALITLNVFKIDIYIFATMILCINIIQNLYDYYKWNKFLR